MSRVAPPLGHNPSGCREGRESDRHGGPQWLSFPFCCKWWNDTDTDGNGWQRNVQVNVISEIRWVCAVPWMYLCCLCLGRQAPTDQAECEFRPSGSWRLVYVVVGYDVFCLLIVYFITLLASQISFELVATVKYLLNKCYNILISVHFKHRT